MCIPFRNAGAFDIIDIKGVKYCWLGNIVGGDAPSDAHKERSEEDGDHQLHKSPKFVALLEDVILPEEK